MNGRMTTCGHHGSATPEDAEPRRCSGCDRLLPYWHELVALPAKTQGHDADLRIDTGDFRLWTSRMGLADGEPYEHTVHVELYDADWEWPLGDVRAGWRDLGHYDGQDPPRGLPGLTPHALRGELKIVDTTPKESAWVASDVIGVEGELLIRIDEDGTLSVAQRSEPWHAWGPPIDAERRH